MGAGMHMALAAAAQSSADARLTGRCAAAASADATVRLWRVDACAGDGARAAGYGAEEVAVLAVRLALSLRASRVKVGSG